MSHSQIYICIPKILHTRAHSQCHIVKSIYVFPRSYIHTLHTHAHIQMPVTYTTVGVRQHLGGIYRPAVHWSRAHPYGRNLEHRAEPTRRIEQPQCGEYVNCLLLFDDLLYDCSEQASLVCSR